MKSVLQTDEITNVMKSLQLAKMKSDRSRAKVMPRIIAQAQ